MFAMFDVLGSKKWKYVSRQAKWVSENEFKKFKKKNKANFHKPADMT